MDLIDDFEDAIKTDDSARFKRHHLAIVGVGQPRLVEPQCLRDGAWVVQDGRDVAAPVVNLFVACNDTFNAAVSVPAPVKVSVLPCGSAGNRLFAAKIPPEVPSGSVIQREPSGLSG